jgi:protoheme IX farnesyltransferase
MSEHDMATVLPSEPVVAAEQGIVKHYYELTKPGITQMVALTTLVGYYVAIPVDLMTFASTWQNWWHFLATMAGTVCVSAGSCVANHILEKNDDAQMKRTASRPLPAGIITTAQAIVFSIVLTVVGIAFLTSTNTLTVVLAIATWLSYVIVYTPMKKVSSLAVLVGGIPGALPFMGGWTAVRDSVDGTAWALFAILFFWQLPHFYALSWMYRTDYREGGYALRSVRDANGRYLAWQKIVTSICTTACLIVPTLLGATGWLYGIGASVLGAWLTLESVAFLRDQSTAKARRVLLTSYAVLMGSLLLMVLDKR